MEFQQYNMNTVGRTYGGLNEDFQTFFIYFHVETISLI